MSSNNQVLTARFECLVFLHEVQSFARGQRFEIQAVELVKLLTRVGSVAFLYCWLYSVFKQ